MKLIAKFISSFFEGMVEGLHLVADAFAKTIGVLLAILFFFWLVSDQILAALQ